MTEQPSVRRRRGTHDVPAVVSSATRAHRLLIVLGGFGLRMSQALAAGIDNDELSHNAPILVLSDLALNGPRRPSQLQLTAGLTSGGMTKQLDRLERLGLVERTFGQVAGDRRASVVSLTDEGRALTDRLAAAVEARMDSVRSLAADVALLLEE